MAPKGGLWAIFAFLADRDQPELLVFLRRWFCS
jgi:hypothetical protein